MKQVLAVVIDIPANQNAGEIDALTCERLRCLLEQERKNPEFQKSPKFKKNTPYTIQRQEKNGQVVIEEITLKQSLILRSSKKGGDRLQIANSVVLGQGGFGKVELATRYLRFLPNHKMDVKTVAQIVKVTAALERLPTESQDQWDERVAENKRQIEAELVFTRAKYRKTKALLMRRFSKVDAQGRMVETVKFYLYMPNLGVDLLKILNQPPIRYQDDSALELMSNICADLASLHALGIIHADVKPENILVDAKDRPSLCDFGVSMWTRAIRAKSGGTPVYAPPEVLHGKPWSFAGDIYSLAGVGGIVFGEANPFLEKAPPGVAANIHNCIKPYVFLNLTYLTAPGTKQCVMKFLELMSAKDPKQRPSARVCQYFFDYMRVRPSPRTLLLGILKKEIEIDELYAGHKDERNELWFILTDPKSDEKKQALLHTLSDRMRSKYDDAIDNPDHLLCQLFKKPPSQPQSQLKDPTNAMISTQHSANQPAVQPAQPPQPVGWGEVFGRVQDNLLQDALSGIKSYLDTQSTWKSRLFGDSDAEKKRAAIYRNLLENTNISKAEKLLCLLVLLETESSLRLLKAVMSEISPQDANNEAKNDLEREIAKESIIQDVRAKIYGRSPTIAQSLQLTALIKDMSNTVKQGLNPLQNVALNLHARLQQLTAKPAAVAQPNVQRDQLS